jgi:arylsulfatase A-like enzyme
MIVSLFDGHKPLTPLARFAGHRSCKGIAPWAPTSFDEADVSDKPRYVRRRGRLDRGAAPLRDRCESILGVDWVTQQVRRALRRAGRLEDTLLIFTADNGYLMGEHRLVGKTYPYATPVPLYMLWPRRWADERRAIREPVSNVDLAPTFCRLAGCSLPGVDGMDLTDLLDGKVRHLDRAFIYEEMLHPGPQGGGRPAWYGIRTTLGYSDTLWVYTEYSTGEVELYDLSRDPLQLANLARRRDHARLRRDLRRMLRHEVVAPHGVRFADTPSL